ncbi:PilW family protein [Nitrospira sp. Kam-Ns4a]
MRRSERNGGGAATRQRPCAGRGTTVNTERGVTLTELLVGLTISSLAIAAGYTVMNTGQKAMVVNDQTAEMQQNVRVSMELLAQDLRTAGFGMNGAVGTCGTAIVPADNTPTGADKGPDAISLVVPTALSTLAASAAGGATTLTLQSGAVANAAPDGFGPGALVSVGGVTTGTVTGIAGDVLTLGAQLPITAVFPVGTQVYWLRCTTYAIGTSTTACSGPAPCMLRGGVAIAEGIEDLQLAYACDGCNAAVNGGVPDGVVDDQNGSGTFDASDFVSNSTWTTSPMTASTIKLVRFSLVARQTRSDQTWSGTAPITVEDHDPTQDPGYSAATYQQFRRRVLTRTVQVRNLALD